ncbi:leucine-rich repeat domain-containing protein [Achromobacter pestifer]|uniref:Leucine-rich repeat domain-containing protein n=1 Tax=Achromobacter pestifer TaxID=1353889 RepID=A0A7D4E2E1_9BURK|nr:leucine-rich repeat domain-containing protein [Achromobacter pestifer]QKH34526.1 leucine-rich repeat domain-containing protein [Achromobacter pestifer]
MSFIPFSIPRPAPAQTWRVMHSRQRSQFPGPDERIVFHDAPPDETILASIEAAHLWTPHGDPLRELPELIARLPSLVHLSVGPGAVSSSVLTGLRADMLPASLRHLSLHPEPGTHTWQAGPLPRLEALTIEATLRFDPEDFPALISLSMVPDRRGTLLDRALSLPLKELNLWNVPFDSSIFDRIAGLPLLSLGLLAGRGLKTLSGIEQLAGLRSLRLKNQTALEAIGPVATLEGLERLDIQYCKRIADIGVLNQLPRLQELTLVGCGDVGLGELAQTLNARLRRVNIAATR